MPLSLFIVAFIQVAFIFFQGFQMPSLVRSSFVCGNCREDNFFLLFTLTVVSNIIARLLIRPWDIFYKNWGFTRTRK